MEPDDEMHVTLDPHGGVMRLTVDGNLDFSTASSLRSYLEACAATPARGCEVYLRRVPLVDSSGLGALIRGYRLFHDSRRSFELLGGDDSIARLLHRTSLDRVIPLHEVHDGRTPVAPGAATDR